MKEAQEKMRSGAAVQRWKMRRVGASIYIICINNMYMYRYIYMGGSINGGTHGYPKNGWFKNGKSIYKWMIWGYPHFRTPP